MGGWVCLCVCVCACVLCAHVSVFMRVCPRVTRINKFIKKKNHTLCVCAHVSDFIQYLYSIYEFLIIIMYYVYITTALYT